MPDRAPARGGRQLQQSEAGGAWRAGVRLPRVSASVSKAMPSPAQPSSPGGAVRAAARCSTKGAGWGPPPARRTQRSGVGSLVDGTAPTRRRAYRLEPGSLSVPGASLLPHKAPSQACIPGTSVSLCVDSHCEEGFRVTLSATRIAVVTSSCGPLFLPASCPPTHIAALSEHSSTGGHHHLISRANGRVGLPLQAADCNPTSYSRRCMQQQSKGVSAMDIWSRLGPFPNR